MLPDPVLPDPVPPDRMHEDQLDATTETVRALLAEQFPQWARLPVSQVRAGGTVNAIFRIGDRLAARLSLRPDDPARTAALLEIEAAAASELAGRTFVATPEPVAIGRPGAGFPMPWSIQTWVPGRAATPTRPGAGPDGDGFARDLARFVTELRAVDVAGRSFAARGLDGARGGALSDHDGWVQQCLDSSAGLIDVDGAQSLWRHCRRLPRRRADAMTHGDLIPGNLLTAETGVGAVRLTGVLDVGGFGPADPALDLVVGWHALDDRPRAVFRATLTEAGLCDELDWDRSRGWALEQALGLVWYYRVSNPAMSMLGATTIGRLLDDAAGPGR